MELNIKFFEYSDDGSYIDPISNDVFKLNEPKTFDKVVEDSITEITNVDRVRILLK